MNVFTFTGNIGGDAEVQDIRGTDLCKFSVAAQAGYGDREQTIWVQVNFWGNRGKAVAPYLKKGDRVAVSGEMSTFEAKNGKTYVQVRASEVTLLSQKQGSTPNGGGGFREKQEPEQVTIKDDDIPF